MTTKPRTVTPSPPAGDRPNPWAGLHRVPLTVMKTAPEGWPALHEMWDRYRLVAQELTGKTEPATEQLALIVGFTRTAQIVLSCEDDRELVTKLAPFLGVKTPIEAIAKARAWLEFMAAERPSVTA